MWGDINLRTLLVFFELLETSLQNPVTKNKVTSTPALATQMALPTNEVVLLYKPQHRQTQYFRIHPTTTGRHALNAHMAFVDYATVRTTHAYS